MQPQTAGLILCGGASSRMGTPKHLLPFSDGLLIERLAKILLARTEKVVIVTGPEHELPTLPKEVTTVVDDRPGDGPLAGIARGLRFLQKDLDPTNSIPVFVTACDCPFLQPELIEQLLETPPIYDAAVYRSAEHCFPVTAMYRTRCADIAEELLEAGERRPRRMLDVINPFWLDKELIQSVDPELRSFSNINTPADYKAALAIDATESACRSDGP